MNVKIVLLYDENRAEIGRLTEGVARAYCTKHGYEFVVYNRPFRPDLPMAFSTMEAMAVEMEANPHIDWFMRLDADSIIVDPHFKLEPLLDCAHSFLGTSDHNGLCTGVFWAKNSGWAAQLLRTLSFLGEMDAAHWGEFDGRNTWDQNTLKALIKYFPRIKKHVGTVNQWIVQNPKAKFNQGAFMMHFWSNSGQEMIAAKMREIIANGWSRQGFYEWGS
jgi:hypothetical protein